MLNNVSEHGATTERINKEVDDILQSKPDHIIIHTDTIDLATKSNPFNKLRKVLNKVTSCPWKLNWVFQTSLREKIR